MSSRIMRCVTASVALCAGSCSNGSTSSTPTVAPPSIATTAKLQFGVGVATIGYPGGSVTGTNFVSTFRGSNGLSATLMNTPTITGPSNFVIGVAGSANSITGTLPNVFNAAVLASASGTAFPFGSFATTLGPTVGVFGYGMTGDNLLSTQAALQFQLDLAKNGSNLCLDLNSSGESFGNTAASDPIGVVFTSNGNASVAATSQAQSHEIGLPLGFLQGATESGAAASASCPTSPLAGVPQGASGSLPINYYGGPPAWPAPQGYAQPTYFLGYSLGFTDVAASPVSGKYSLDVAYPTNDSATTYGHSSATATLNNLTPLPPITIDSATVNSDGTGSVSVNVPLGVTEAVIIARAQSCSDIKGQGTANYAIVTHSTGAQSIQFAANLGAPSSSGLPSKTFCGGQTLAFAVGFDYTAYESSYPFDVSQTPKITNATGQADVTTSAPLSFSNIPTTVP